MSYGVELGSEVRQLLRELPGEVGELLLDGLDRLAEQPTKLSRSSSTGNSGIKAQVYDFPLQTKAGKYLAIVKFQYSQDEQSLHIDTIDLVKE